MPAMSSIWIVCAILVVQVLAMVVIIFGLWMSTRHDACRKSLTIPVLSIGAVIFLMLVFSHSFMIFWCLLFFWIFFCYSVVFNNGFVLYRSIVGFLGAKKRSSILLWIVSLSNVIICLPQTLKLKNSSRKFWIKGNPPWHCTCSIWSCCSSSWWES